MLSGVAAGTVKQHIRQQSGMLSDLINFLLILSE